MRSTVPMGKLATPSPEELLATSELVSDSVEMAETQLGLLPSNCFDLRIRTGESEVDGRATQSMMLVKKVDIFRSGEGGEVVIGGGVEVDTLSLSLCDMSIVLLRMVDGADYSNKDRGSQLLQCFRSLSRA